MLFLDSAVECEHRRGIVWHTVVRPGSEVELSDLQRFVASRHLCKCFHRVLSYFKGIGNVMCVT